ncbi:MAG TPA: VOC family protein [Chloroflexota bacterium]|jgi:predicted enzyme related to lactoylglutathione lyase|nr:VOC family protein [Chloroflexota bacterium]
MSQPIVHFEIMGKDAVRLRKFYADLFSWKIGDPMPDMGMYAMVDASSSGVAGGIGQEQDGSTRVTVYVQVPDLQATLDQAVELGGKVVMPPMDIPGVVSLAQFADPDGNIIGLVKG